MKAIPINIDLEWDKEKRRNNFGVLYDRWMPIKKSDLTNLSNKFSLGIESNNFSSFAEIHSVLYIVKVYLMLYIVIYIHILYSFYMKIKTLKTYLYCFRIIICSPWNLIKLKILTSFLGFFYGYIFVDIYFLQLGK